MRSRAILWLAKRIDVEPDLLENIIKALREAREGMSPSMSLYQIIVLKRGPKKRKIHIPCPELKKVQARINQRILAKLPGSPNAFGFSGGSIEEAIRPHLESPAILICDIKDAFPNTRWHWVFSVFRSHFSESLARLLTLLCTAPPGWRLPQGAPTSPRLFDLHMRITDRDLTELAERVDGKYTRYADNLLISAEEERLRKVEKEIFAELRMAELVPHKIRIRRLNGPGAVKLLGLNVIEQKVHNTRDFKRRLRLAIHHIGWLLDNGMRDTPEFEKAWKKLRGQMAFARIDTIPQKTLGAYAALEKRLA